MYGRCPLPHVAFRDNHAQPLQPATIITDDDDTNVTVFHSSTAYHQQTRTLMNSYGFIIGPVPDRVV